MWICLPSRLGNGSTRRVQSLAGINHRLRRIIPLEQLSHWVNRMIKPKNDNSLFILPSYFRDVHTNVLGRFWGKFFSRPLGKRHQGSQQIKNFERHTIFLCCRAHWGNTEGGIFLLPLQMLHLCMWVFNCEYFISLLSQISFHHIVGLIASSLSNHLSRAPWIHGML